MTTVIQILKTKHKQTKKQKVSHYKVKKRKKYCLWKHRTHHRLNKRAMIALHRSPEYHSTRGEYDLIRGTFLRNYFEIRP